MSKFEMLVDALIAEGDPMDRPITCVAPIPTGQFITGFGKACPLPQMEIGQQTTIQEFSKDFAIVCIAGVLGDCFVVS